MYNVPSSLISFLLFSFKDSEFDSDGSRTPDSQKSTPRIVSCDSHDSYFTDKSGLGGKDINAFVFNSALPLPCYDNKMSRRGSRSSLTSHRQSFPSNPVSKSGSIQSSQKHGITLNLLQNSFRPSILSEELDKFTDFQSPKYEKEISVNRNQNQNQNQNIVTGTKHKFHLPSSNQTISNLTCLEKKNDLNISVSPQSVSYQILSTQASRSNPPSPVLFHSKDDKRSHGFFDLDLNLNDIINNNINRQNIKSSGNDGNDENFNTKMQKITPTETGGILLV